MSLIYLRQAVARQIQRVAPSQTLSRQFLSATLAPLGPWKTATIHSLADLKSASLTHASSFHSTVFRSAEGKAIDGLMDVLSREHTEEMENASGEMPDDLEKLQKTLSGKDWKIVDSPDTGITRLVRTTKNNLKVQVSFHCQDTVEDDYLEEGGEQENDEDFEPSVPIRFSVLATKAGQTMVFTCLSDETAAQIQSVAITSSQDESSILTNGYLPSQSYQGPEFTQLAEDLQASFQTFLEEEIGVDTDVASFIAMYADYKEQNQYLNFLDRCKKILV